MPRRPSPTDPPRPIRRRAPGGGRKPLPTAIKELRGNPGRRDLTKARAIEERAVPGLPDRPFGLDALERRRWIAMARELQVLGVLTKVDGGALLLLVRARVRWERAHRKTRKLGEVLEDTVSGRLYRNPWAISSEKARQEYYRLCVEFGLTPASRPKVAAGVVAGEAPPPATKPAADPTRDFFDGE